MTDFQDDEFVRQAIRQALGAGLNPDDPQQMQALADAINEQLAAGQGQTNAGPGQPAGNPQAVDISKVNDPDELFKLSGMGSRQGQKAEDTRPIEQINDPSTLFAMGLRKQSK
jgi:hypothetical protein